jgi:glycosyltransferase involved in cell wall biosynthesis
MLAPPQQARVGTTSKRSLKVWVVQTGESLPTDDPAERPMRATQLARALIARGHEVTVISSAFWHQKKQHRVVKVTEERFHPRGTVVLIPSPGYRRHVGPARFHDHWRLARAFRDLAKGLPGPDAAIIGFPPIEIAWEAVHAARGRGATVLLDVKDQWPEIFWERLPAPLRPLGRAALTPLRRLAARCFREADGITSMSEPFLEWALARSGRPRRAADGAFPFGVDMPGAAARPMTDDARDRISFVGSMTGSFDFATLIAGFRASSFCARGGRLVFCGSGDALPTVQRLAAGHPGIEFRGWVKSDAIAGELAKSVLGAAPYVDRGDFRMSIPNKVCEYLAHGVPVLASDVGEGARLVRAHGVGTTYQPGSATSCARCIDSVTAADRATSHAVRERAYEIFKSEFLATQVYGRFVRHLEQAVDAKRQRVTP